MELDFVMVQQPSSSSSFNNFSSRNVVVVKDGSDYTCLETAVDPIARAYREASDEDVRIVLNAMSDASLQQVACISFYIVATEWLRKAWPFLQPDQSSLQQQQQQQQQQHRPHAIHNASLLSMDHPISSSSSSSSRSNSGSEGEEEQGDTKSERQRVANKWKDRQRQFNVVNNATAKKNLLRENLIYGNDFVLLGPNAWLLLKEKFGFDVQLECPLFLQQHPRQLVVIVNDAVAPKLLVPIPSTGRFSYNDFVSPACAVAGRGGGGGRAVTLEEENQETSTTWNGMANNNNNNQKEVFEPAPIMDKATAVTTNVVPNDEDDDDNDNQDYDLFPGVEEEDDVLTSSSSPAKPEPILLLPPSTTTAIVASHNNNSNDDIVDEQDREPSSNNNNNRLYPAVHDMEFEYKPDDEEIVDADVTTATTTTPNKRKRHGAGLGNLGNTCFMNSTLQCLAHTHPLRRYFVSGEYEKDLNRNNPLGTGGELATQFAELLAQMWGISSQQPQQSQAVSTAPVVRRTLFPHSNSSSSSTNYYGTSVVYPRSFKFTLGRHAEQFMGYDQHDSQELATYLLDALHEDTNRVTKKPYVEKPEQAEDEPDDEASDKAWRLHLQREDSRVLENFMGQIKSRVQCPEEGCGRVSKTFDPFMYLSVPITGATYRTIQVTFFPLDPLEPKKNVRVTLPKISTVGALLQKVSIVLHSQGITPEAAVSVENLRAADVWRGEIYKRFRLDDAIDKIKDQDTTLIYEMRSLAEVRDGEAMELSKVDLSLLDRNRGRSYLDLAIQTRLSADGEWMATLENYVQTPNNNGLKHLFNTTKKGRMIEELVKFHRELDKFLDKCRASSDILDAAGHKRSHEESSSTANNNNKKDSPNKEKEEETNMGENGNESRTPPSSFEVSQARFCNLKTKQDIDILEYCCTKLRQYTKKIIFEKKQKHKDCVEIHIVHRKGGVSPAAHIIECDPLLLRIPLDMTVYGLREELANRLSRSLKTWHTHGRGHDELGANKNVKVSSLGPVSAGDGESDNSAGVPAASTTTHGHGNSATLEHTTFGSPKLLVLRQVPISYSTSGSGHSNRSQFVARNKLGVLDYQHYGGRSKSLASPRDDEEKEIVADVVGHEGTIFLEWPEELCANVFDVEQYQSTVDVTDESEARQQSTLAAQNASRAITVLDCIDKYCQIEQLEETEMWYCNQCKKHVRAWKQFHLYRTPPILIVHLKRFHYSASSHRRDKIDVFIDFPLVGLDLTNHATHWTDDVKPVYDCYAVSNHYGGLGGGHYTAYALSDDGEWCHFDDSRVTAGVDPREVVSQAAYVLYYRRRDVEVSNDIFDMLLPNAAAPAAAVVQHAHSERLTTTTNGEETHFSGGDVARIIRDEEMDVVEETASPPGSIRTCQSPMETTGGILDDLDEFGVGDNHSVDDNDTDHNKYMFEGTGSSSSNHLPAQ